MRRVDNKYALPVADFEQLARLLKSDHQVLEIDGGRRFRYSSNYFETPDLRCFTDHTEDRLPRFKVRSRCYEDSEECVFEVKLKRSEDEMDKRQIAYATKDRQRLTAEARECLRSALADVGLEAPGDLRNALTTEFERVTLAALRGSERLTCDLGVQLTGPDGDSVRMRGGLVLVETKSETGEGPADRKLEQMGHEPISLSKYRVGMSVVGGARRFGAQPGTEFFER